MGDSILKIARIDGQKHRTLLFGEGDDLFYVIAANSKVKDFKLKVGDTIEYQPYGTNFGWFVDKKAA